MKQKELTKTFIMISQIEKPFGLYGSCESISAFQGLWVKVSSALTNLWPYKGTSEPWPSSWLPLPLTAVSSVCQITYQKDQVIFSFSWGRILLLLVEEFNLVVYLSSTGNFGPFKWFFTRPSPFQMSSEITLPGNNVDRWRSGWRDD